MGAEQCAKSVPINPKLIEKIKIAAREEKKASTIGKTVPPGKVEYAQNFKAKNAETLEHGKHWGCFFCKRCFDKNKKTGMPGHTLYERKSLKEKKCPKCGGTTWIENQEKGTRNVFKDSIKMLTKKFKEAIAHFEKACKQHSEARYECQLQKWEKKNKHAGKWSSYEPQHNVQIAKLLSDDDSCVIDTKHGRFRIERRHGQLRQVGLYGIGEDFGRPVRLVPLKANYVNEHGDRMTPSPQPNNRIVHYCGTFIGKEVMRKAGGMERSWWDELVGNDLTDGRCGPNQGPQCASCQRCIDSSATNRVIDSFQVMCRAKMAVDNYSPRATRSHTKVKTLNGREVYFNKLDELYKANEQQIPRDRWCGGNYDHGALLVEEGQLRRTRGTLARMKHDLAEASKAFSQVTGLMPKVYGKMFQRGPPQNAPKAIILQKLSVAKLNFKTAKSNMTQEQKENTPFPVLCEGCLDTGKAPCGKKCRRCCQNRYGMLHAGWRMLNSDDPVEVYYDVYSEEHGTYAIDKITKVPGGWKKLFQPIFKVEFTVKGKTETQVYSSLKHKGSLKEMVEDLRS